MSDICLIYERKNPSTLKKHHSIPYQNRLVGGERWVQLHPEAQSALVNTVFHQGCETCANEGKYLFEQLKRKDKDKPYFNARMTMSRLRWCKKPGSEEPTRRCEQNMKCLNLAEIALSKGWKYDT